jgi:chemotaxis protein histidine kinase CheA
MADDATLVAALSKSAESVGRLGEFASLHEKARADAAAVPAAEAQVAAAKTALDQYAAVMTQADGTLTAAKQKLAETQQQKAAAEQELAKRQAIAQSLAAAVAQAETANGQLADAALAEAVNTIKTKATEAAARVAEATPPAQTAQSAEQQAAAAVATAEQARQAATTEQLQRQQAVTQAEAALATARTNAESAKVAADAARVKAAEDRAAAFAASPLKPLSPEQLCFAMLRVTGQYENYWKAEEAAMNSAAPLPADASPEQVAARKVELEQKVYDKLKGNVPTFVSVYAPGAGQPQGDFFATADQALFTANGGAVLGWLGAGGGNLPERLNNQADPKAAAEDLYLTILARRPTDAETAEVTAYLAARPQEKAACVQELIWALLTSAEFRFNH